MRELLGSVMIIASFAFLGWEQKEKLRRRAVTLAVLGQALERMRRELECRLIPLKSLMELMSRESGASVRELFLSCREAMERMEEENFQSVWKNSLTKVINIQPEDRALLETLGSTLGRYDVREQTRSLYSVEEMLRERYMLAERERKRLGKVYQTTMTAFGIALVILFL